MEITTPEPALAHRLRLDTGFSVQAFGRGCLRWKLVRAWSQTENGGEKKEERAPSPDEAQAASSSLGKHGKTIHAQRLKSQTLRAPEMPFTPPSTKTLASAKFVAHYGGHTRCAGGLSSPAAASKTTT
ncbi:MAG: hypothetical protein ABSB82_03440 [Terriglobia bacterium]